MKDALEGWEEWRDTRHDKYQRILGKAEQMAILLARAERELQNVLKDINADRIPHDGDDFHELLGDIRATLESIS
jgi:hypothetical protein